MIDKNLLQEADIFLFHTRGFSPVSMAIRQLTGSFWNHCGMFTDGCIIEALGDGVVKTPVEKYLAEKAHIIRVVRIKQKAFKDKKEYSAGVATALKNINERIGKKYDYYAIAWLGIKFTFKGLLSWTGNPLQQRSRFFCSELLADACYGISSITQSSNIFAGIKHQSISTTTPRDISKSVCVEYAQGKDLI